MLDLETAIQQLADTKITDLHAPDRLQALRAQLEIRQAKDGGNIGHNLMLQAAGVPRITTQHATNLDSGKADLSVVMVRALEPVAMTGSIPITVEQATLDRQVLKRTQHEDDTEFHQRISDTAEAMIVSCEATRELGQAGVEMLTQKLGAKKAKAMVAAVRACFKKPA